MFQIFSRFVSWLAQKSASYAMIFAMLLVIFIIGNLPQKLVDYHEVELERAISKLKESKELVGDLAIKAQDLSSQIKGSMAELKELEEKRRSLGKWLEKVKKLFGAESSSADEKKMAAEESKLRQKIRESDIALRDIRNAGGDTEEEVKRREILLHEKEAQLRKVHELRAFFDSFLQKEVKQLAYTAALILLSLILVPLLWKLVAFYYLAPIIERSEPIAFSREQQLETNISASTSHPAQTIELEQDEILLTKADYLQGSMGDFIKKTKWLMDWRYPFSSLAAGLVVMTRIQKNGDGRGQVTLSTQDNATEELALVHIPAGESLVFLPRFLVAVSHPMNFPPLIRSRWVLHRLHAWMNFQFRHLILVGPATCVFAAQRGLHVEKIDPEMPGRRVNRALTAAFGIHLLYSPKRAETLVAYLRGKNALFDDFFQGQGLVMQQQVSNTTRNPAGRIWDSFFSAIGKILGI